jgi:hypothetical protein
MESTVIIAMAAAVGSLMGATASIATTWINQRNQTVRSDSEWKLRERASLYKKFIKEASRLTVDALAHSLERPDQLMVVYSVLSSIRLMSGEEVVRHGEACCRRIIELYGRPNLTTDQIRTSVENRELDDIDPLKEFSTACRHELLGRRDSSRNGERRE